MCRDPKYIFQRRYTDGQQAHEKMLSITNHQGNANQKHNAIPLSFLKVAILKRQQNTSAGKDVVKKGNLVDCSRNVNWHNHYGKKYKFPQKLTIELPYNSPIPFLCMYLWKTIT